MEFGTTASVVVALAVTAVALVGVVSIRRRRRGTARWVPTPGTVLRSTIQIQRTGSNRHERPVVEYSYTIGGRTFEGSRIRVRDASGDGASSAARIVQRYPVGATVRVYVDPRDPTMSVLER